VVTENIQYAHLPRFTLVFAMPSPKNPPKSMLERI
jgi:hypothetical protein